MIPIIQSFVNSVALCKLYDPYGSSRQLEFKEERTHGLIKDLGLGSVHFVTN